MGFGFRKRQEFLIFIDELDTIYMKDVARKQEEDRKKEELKNRQNPQNNQRRPRLPRPR